MNKLKKRITCILTTLCILLVNSIYVFAEKETEVDVSKVTKGIDSFKNIIISIAAAGGGIFAVIAVVDLASSISGGNGTEIMQNIKKLAAASLIISVSLLVKLFT
ncbi:hypothetical protein SAMN02745111_02474 [Eubacterium uniforme]|uniref:TrbC/VIRB2 family protein n=2 Tax=Eubacterium uniforme TaxID=39495 RepID=A0A1T4W9L7_9FIRM|nr:major capsid protein [Eubacterium uniforme]SKA73963.1 hypothetical protein SAMN02745111_02474 [Eubacterium uniforme]